MNGMIQKLSGTPGQCSTGRAGGSCPLLHTGYPPRHPFPYHTGHTDLVSEYALEERGIEMANHMNVLMMTALMKRLSRTPQMGTVSP